MCEHRNAVVLDRPWFMEGTDERRNGVPVDGCLPDVIEHLWEKSLVTLGSCCGHGEQRASLVIGNGEDPVAVWDAIAEVDGREFELLQWRLLSLGSEQPVSYIDPPNRGGSVSHQKTGKKTLWVLQRTVDGDIRPASSSEIIEAAFANFPSDEDIEVAAKAMAGPHEWERSGGLRQTWTELARAALQAVTDACRTEEKG